jgi:hypothetical protein
MGITGMHGGNSYYGGENTPIFGILGTKFKKVYHFDSEIGIRNL